MRLYVIFATSAIFCSILLETPFSGYFFLFSTVYITVWITLWRMCKTLNCEYFMTVDRVFWKILRNNISVKIELSCREKAENP